MEGTVVGGRSGCGEGSAVSRSEEDFADVDQIVRDDPESDKTAHTFRAFVATTIHAMAPLQNTDAAFTAGAPFHGFFEPRPFLALFALRAFGGLTGHCHPPNAQFLSLGFVGCREEAGVSGGQFRRASE